MTPPPAVACLALDLGLSTGWALACPPGLRKSGVQTFPLARGESPGMRYLRFTAWLTTVAAPLVDATTTGTVAVLVYEAPHHRGGAATEIAYGLATRVQEYAARVALPHAAVHSATLKKFTTGHGNADKAAMADAIARRGWLPRADRPLTAYTPDELDALALLHYAASTLFGGALSRGT
jgi:hypothetical protein